MKESAARENSRSRSESQSLQAVMGLRELVLNGELSPGERLSELALVEQLSVSRTPIRAALQTLAAEGLVEPIPSGGYAVRSFTLDEIADAMELRGTVEGLAVRFAAEKGAPPARLMEARAILDGIDALLIDVHDDFDFDAYVSLNGRFHSLLTDLAQSRIVEHGLESVCALPFASPNAFVEAHAQHPDMPNILKTAQEHHRIMVEAIELREGARAEATAREHARLARRHLNNIVGDDTMRRRVRGLSLVRDR